MTLYVAGFLFSPDRSSVALVRKVRPAWQAGLLNGIGGHIEEDESAGAAMRREFWEETGVDLDWGRQYALLEGPWGQVNFFRAFSGAIADVHTTTDEQIEVHRLDEMPWGQALPNLSWLIPLALYRHDRYMPIIATEVVR